VAEPPLEVKSSPFKFIVPGVMVILVLGLLGFAAYWLLNNRDKKTPIQPNKNITLAYWGLWESASTMKPIIDAFEAQNPNIQISYQLQNHSDYQDRLITNLKDPLGSPDIVRLHSTWLPLLYQNLLPAPANTLTLAELETNFYPAINQIIINKQIYGVPLTMEGLGLFINTQMFDAATLPNPITWEDLKTASQTLTQKDPSGTKIIRAGVALGNTTNVDYWPDIVSLMLLQSGNNLLQPGTETFASTLRYYTSFQNTIRVWDSSLPSSTLAFANEKVAAILAPSWAAFEIQSINPNLAWKIIPVPQLPESTPVTWTSYWIESVSKNSQHPQEAWQFLKYLSSSQAQQLLFESASRERGFSQAPAHKAVASLAALNPITAPFINQLGSAKTFYTASLTHDSDTALNSRLIKYLEDAVNSVLQNPQAVDDASLTLGLGFNQVLSQYQLVAPVSSDNSLAK